jgi:hypothetical protein
MEFNEWWPRLSAGTRAWLIANNGDVVPRAIVDEIVAAGGVVSSDSTSVGGSGPSGFLLSYATTDWIEAAANDES